MGSLILLRFTVLYCKRGWDYFNAAMERTSVEVLLGNAEDAAGNYSRVHSGIPI